MTRRSIIEKSPAPSGQPATPPRYVEIIRVSSKAQADRDTPQDQRNALDAYARAHPGTLVERIEYGARGLSGGKGFADRPDLQRLKELSDAHAYDEVRVRWVNRLTRHEDAREWFLVFGMVMDADAVIIEVATGTPLDPADEMGEFHLFLKGWFGRHERRDIREKTKTGKERKLREGAIVSAQPWGRTWDRVHRQWNTDPRIMEILRSMVRDILAGHTAGEVAARLNREGVLTPRGACWHRSHVCRMLRLSNLSGRLPDGLGGTRDCPGAVDEATHREVIARLEKNATRSGPPRRIEALLRGIATCATCGSAMYVNASGTPGKNGTGRIHYYGCSAALRTVAGIRVAVAPECRRLYRLDAVDAEVRRSVIALLADPARLLAAAKAGKPTAAAERIDPRAAQREIDALDARTERLARLDTTGKVPRAVADRQYAEIARLRATAEATLAAARAQAVTCEVTEASARRVEQAVMTLRAKVKAGTFAAFRAVVVALFPPGDPRGSLKITPDGRLTGIAMLPLDGAAAPPPPEPGTRRNGRKSPSSIGSVPPGGPDGSNTAKLPGNVIPLSFRGTFRRR